MNNANSADQVVRLHTHFAFWDRFPTSKVCYAMCTGQDRSVRIDDSPRPYTRYKHRTIYTWKEVLKKAHHSNEYTLKKIHIMRKSEDTIKHFSPSVRHIFTTAGPAAAAALTIEFFPRHPVQHDTSILESWGARGLAVVKCRAEDSTNQIKRLCNSKAMKEKFTIG